MLPHFLISTGTSPDLITNDQLSYFQVLIHAIKLKRNAKLILPLLCTAGQVILSFYPYSDILTISIYLMAFPRREWMSRNK